MKVVHSEKDARSGENDVNSGTQKTLKAINLIR